MTQEQYNRYMDGLVLKVASKRPFGKVASFVRKHAAVDDYAQYKDERAQAANEIAELGRLYGNGMAQEARSVIPDNKTETDNKANELNENISEIELKSKVQAANSALDALYRTRDMTEKAIRKINDSNEAIHRKEMKTPEAPSWYSKAYEWVKANPKTSLAIGGGALAGGLLLAYLMRKKEKDAKKQKATKKHKFIVGNSSLAFA